MDLYAVIDQVAALLQQRGRLTYQALTYQFKLDREGLAALKAELIEGQQVAVDEGGKVLVWKAADAPSSAPSSPTVQPQTPVSYTPAHLAERIRAEQVALEARGTTEGERKTITALFADLKGSTALIEGLDPEEARAIIDPALQLMMDAVHQYEGYVAKTLGDGILALFGAPIAHEDHPQRALYAALRMQGEMRRYSDALRGRGYPPLFMRVGLNTGEVVVRSIRTDDLHTDYDPIGHSTHVASRMEQLASPGAIVVSAHTQKLTEGYFAFRDLGPTTIKGVEEPLHIYELQGVGPLRTRLQVSASRGLTRFVGREREMEQLNQALEQTKAGHGQIVGVMGEPGLGKSRLFYEFTRLSQSGCLILEAYSVSYGKASPYLPVIELLKSYFRIEPPDDERQRRAKVMGQVLVLDRDLEDTLPYLFALLGIEEQPSPLQQMDPQLRRKRTFQALKKLLLRESLNLPLILLCEDLHWIDSETQGFLDVLSEGIASAKILLVVNYRPEYRHEWGQKTYYTQLRLVPLGKAEAEELLTFLLGNDATLTPLKQQILTKTEGTPFFMEEVVQTLAEEGVLAGERGHYQLTQHVTTLHIPPTVQGILAARIDRLAPEEKALLQQLAVIGREFPVSLVRWVIAQPEEELYRRLSALQSKEYLYEQPAVTEVEYIFKHALTQEVAYNSVLIERRKALHEQTAQAIEQLFQDRLEEHYSELAYHYQRSSNTEKAIEYLQLAGQQAVQRSANVEAISHLKNALELLKTLPDTPEYAQQELTLQTTLGPALMATKGYAAPELGKTYTRAHELCQQVGETPQLFPVLMGLYAFHILRAELQTARELGEQLLRLAQSVQDPGLLLAAHHSLGIPLLLLGESTCAREHLERGIALYDPGQHRSYTFLYGQDLGVTCRSHVARVLWRLGYPDLALKRSHEALTLAEEVSHPFSLAVAMNFAAALHQYRREGQAARECAEATITLTTEQGFALRLAYGMILRGWALAEQGQGEEGIVQIRQGLVAWRATGAELDRPYFLALLAEAYGKTGQVEEGLIVLAEALDIVEKTGERFYEAELHRLKGELTLQQSKTSSVQVSGKSTARQDKSDDINPESLPPNPQAESEAEACFLKAIEIAQRQQAKSLELRATMSLSRLWHHQGKKAEAHKLLSEVYNWFTEGLATKDMQEAKALLALLEELDR